MLAVSFLQPEEFKLIDVPEPHASPGQLLVQVKSTTICGTDFKIFHGLYPDFEDDLLLERRFLTSMKQYYK